MKIFLSYRRADSQAIAGRMAQFLDGVPAVERVFLDVDDIALGEDFEQRIARTLAEATHVFVLIGGQWRGAAAAGGPPRLLQPDDPVRQELRLALASAARVVPLLIDGTPMPQPAELPPELVPLHRLNAFSLRSARFDEDMDDLLDELAGGRPGRGSRWQQAPLTPGGIAWRALAGATGGGVLLLVLALANRLFSDCYDLACRLRRSFGIASDNDALGLLWLIALALLAVGAALPFVPRWRQRWRR